MEEKQLQNQQPAPQKDLVRTHRIVFFALCIAFAVLAVLGIVLGTSKVQMCREMRFFSCDSRGFHLISCGVGTTKRTGGPIDVESLPTPDAALFSEAMVSDVDYYESGEIKEVPIFEQQRIDRYIFSMIIVVQNGSLESQDKQTDMIFLASFNQMLQKFTIVSVARDTLVPLSEDEWKRINTAYSRGGIGQLINTVNDVFELDIQNYIVTGTDELAALADEIGGIPARLTEEEAAYINAACGGSLKPQKQQLSGEEIITLLLDRTSDGKGDLGRADRQVGIVENAFWYMKDKFDSSFLYPFFKMIFKSIQTNVDFYTLREIGIEMSVAEDLTFSTIRVPFDDAYTELNVDGAYALLPAIEKNRILIRQALYGTRDIERDTSEPQTSARSWVLPVVLSAIAIAAVACIAVFTVRRGKKKPQGTEEA